MTIYLLLNPIGRKVPPPICRVGSWHFRVQKLPHIKLPTCFWISNTDSTGQDGMTNLEKFARESLDLASYNINNYSTKSTAHSWVSLIKRGQSQAQTPHTHTFYQYNKILALKQNLELLFYKSLLYKVFDVRMCLNI
jgi:hypothetical protein